MWKKYFWEESANFLTDENDSGHFEDCQLKIKLIDETPVQKQYNSIPKALCQPVKDHICDLLNKGWINKFSSNYSSPVVIARKKGRSIRTCVDYRILNKRYLQDKSFKPKIQYD